MNEPGFRFCDDLGPKAILHLYQPTLGMRGIVVVDNVAIGPAIGGTRMAPDVTLEECFRLARAMTFKNAAAGLPHGGAKSVIVGDPAMEPETKEEWIRAFARGIEGLTDYIPGPDMGTNEAAMAWVRDEIGRAAGLPKEIGGIPLDEIGATAFGLVVAADVAKDSCGMSLEGARFAVQGFGAFGRHAARFFAGRGAVCVALRTLPARSTTRAGSTSMRSPLTSAPASGLPISRRASSCRATPSSASTATS
jgi:glutamate dehydrogenase (NAD(P)+)